MFITEKRTFPSGQKPVHDCLVALLRQTEIRQGHPSVVDASTPEAQGTTERGSATRGVYCWCANRLDGSQDLRPSETADLKRSHTTGTHYRTFPLRVSGWRPRPGAGRVAGRGRGSAKGREVEA